MLFLRYICIMKWIPYNLINKIIFEPPEKGNPFGKLSVVLVLSLSIPHISFCNFVFPSTH